MIMRLLPPGLLPRKFPTYVVLGPPGIVLVQVILLIFPLVVILLIFPLVVILLIFPLVIILITQWLLIGI